MSYGCTVNNPNRDIETGNAKIRNSKPLWDNKHIRLEKKLEIGSDDQNRDEYLFGLISDMKIDKYGNIYILDKGLSRVQKYDNNGKFLSSLILQSGEGPGELKLPRLIVVDSLENIFISDDFSRKISVFNKSQQFLYSFNVAVRPAQMVIGANQNIYLTGFLFSYSGAIIHVYSTKGELVNKFCQRREDSGLVMRTGNVGRLAVDRWNNIYYSFHYPYDIRKFSPSGKLTLRFARDVSFFKPPKAEANMYLSLSGSRGLAIMTDGKIVNFIFDARNRYYLDLFNRKGYFLTTLPLQEFGINMVRMVTADNQRSFYFDKQDPYPHIVKYQLEIKGTQK